jgi:hypothetical protein
MAIVACSADAEVTVAVVETSVPPATDVPATSTPTVEPTSVVVLVTTPTPTNVPPTASPTVAPTIVIPTSTTVPTATVLVAPPPTATPTQTPSPTATPLPTTDPRYGVIANSAGSVGHVTTLGVDRYLDFSSITSDIPSGTKKLLHITTISPVPVAEINSAAAAAPGSTWYVTGEPNVNWVDPASAVAYHDTYAAIKAADPTAKLTSPSILNFDFTCIGCGGYMSGHTWLDTYISSYNDIYGINPPVDYWAIDVYPIIWDTNQIPTVRSDIVIDQLTDYRAYLDNMPSEVGKPIIMTEFGLHWGFDGMTFSGATCSGAYPEGTYQPAAVITYLKDVFTWLEANADSSNIDSWYLFSTYRDLVACNPDKGYGLTLFDSSSPTANLSPVGQFYYDWIRGDRD